MEWKQGLKDRKNNNSMYSRLKSIRNLCAALCAIFCLTLSFPAQAQTDENGNESTNLILLLQPKNRKVTGYQELQEALEAHLGSNSIEVKTLKTERFSRIPSEQISNAKMWARERNASAVIWIYIPSQTLFVIFEDQDGNEQTLSRYFNCISKSLGRCGDAIASAVSSALSVWIGHEDPQAATGVSANDNELSPVALEGADWKTPSVLACFFGDAGYVFNFGNPQSFTHGVHLGAGAIWRRHLSFEISGEVLAPITTEVAEDGSRSEVRRRPVRILFGERLPIKRVSLGIAVGLLLSFDIHEQKGFDAEVSQNNYTVPGFTSNISFRYRLLDHLGFFTSAGMDTYSRTESFGSSTDTSSINISAFQWRLVFGFELSFEVRNSN